MQAKCQVQETEGRELDSYDLITVLGLLKEYDWKEIWRRYGPGGTTSGKINLMLSLADYYVEMTLEMLASLALSPKYQASPNLMQSLIRRLLCSHRHGLILDKLKSYGVPIEDENQINLSCSVGTIGVDMVVNRAPKTSEYRFRKFGTSRVEQEEQRPLDHYDVVSILYLAQQNRTGQVLQRYVPQEILNEGAEGEQVVRFKSLAGEYDVDFFFQRIHNDVPRGMPVRGNVSSATMHNILRRLFAGHAPELTVKELTGKGIVITQDEVYQGFDLARILNDNFIEVHFKR
ncbi:MAG: hypothetical protein M1438_13195 [Deltaproteobacteria bacterium]|nr:hypothetical protein [Deltaproteobacteria bacterium]